MFETFADDWSSSAYVKNLRCPVNLTASLSPALVGVEKATRWNASAAVSGHFEARIEVKKWTASEVGGVEDAPADTVVFLLAGDWKR